MKKTMMLLLLLSVFLAACTSHESPSGESPQPSITETPSDSALNIEDIPSTILPLPATVDLEHLNDCTIAVSLSNGSIFLDDNSALQILAAVYAYDLYDAVELSQMKTGDTLVIRSQEIPITSLEYSTYGSLIINGGLDVGGYEFYTDENTVYYETGYSDMKAWREIGIVTLPVSSEFVYTDSSDLDNEPVLYYYDDLLPSNSSIDYHFTPQNTSLVIENGMVIAMNRIYTP